ncbi:hypothetical protein MMC18_000387 [Xylographa bjoerkii]|nr:hypothetical protein [Xylographa bjoerkii]
MSLISIETITVTAPTTIGLQSITAIVTGSSPSSVTSVPRLIEPPSGNLPSPPQDTILVQVGFLDPLDYAFVAFNNTAILQIFRYIPEAIAYSVSMPLDSITMRSIQPYDTGQTYGYITTLACVYVPSNLVNEFSTALNTPDSAFYNNPNSSVHDLTSFVNPAVPVLAGSTTNFKLTTTAASATSATFSVSVTSTLSTANASSTLANSVGSSLSSGAVIGVGIVIPLVIITLVLLALFWFRNRRRRGAKKDAVEKDDDDKIQEMVGDSLKHELQAGENRHELRTKEKPQELEEHTQPRQEIGRVEYAQELEARELRRV